MTEYLTTDDVVLIADELGLVIRDLGLLAGSIARPQASAFGEDAYETLPAKIAAIVESINRTHPLVDGNRRLSWTCAVIFAWRNGWDLAADQTEIDATIRNVAAEKMPLEQLTAWVTDHTSRT